MSERTDQLALAASIVETRARNDRLQARIDSLLVTLTHIGSGYYAAKDAPIILDEFVTMAREAVKKDAENARPQLATTSLRMDDSVHRVVLSHEGGSAEVTDDEILAELAPSAIIERDQLLVERQKFAERAAENMQAVYAQLDHQRARATEAERKCDQALKHGLAAWTAMCEQRDKLAARVKDLEESNAALLARARAAEDLDARPVRELLTEVEEFIRTELENREMGAFGQFDAKEYLTIPRDLIARLNVLLGVET